MAGAASSASAPGSLASAAEPAETVTTAAAANRTTPAPAVSTTSTAPGGSTAAQVEPTPPAAAPEATVDPLAAPAAVVAETIEVPGDLNPVRSPEQEAKPSAPGQEAPVAPSAPASATPIQTSPAAPPAAPSAPPIPPQLATQLSGQLTSLRALPQGDHVLTLTVNPDTFGPVKVVARIGADGVSLELLAASDQSRAALRAALPDLRRDLVAVGLDPRLQVGDGASSGTKDQSTMADPRGFGQQPSGRSGAGGPRGSAMASSSPEPLTTIPSRVARQGGIDLDL